MTNKNISGEISSNKPNAAAEKWQMENSAEIKEAEISAEEIFAGEIANAILNSVE